jgi:gentisate 1,2-dioxygenase
MDKTYHLKKMFKKKQRLYKQAKRTNKWNNYKHFQKEIKKQIRKAEWTYINDTILKGLKSNNAKPFWKYIKSRKNDNIGVSPLKSSGKLVSDSKGKDEILTQQFKFVFTVDKSTAIGT